MNFWIIDFDLPIPFFQWSFGSNIYIKKSYFFENVLKMVANFYSVLFNNTYVWLNILSSKIILYFISVGKRLWTL